jgi:methylisocitrate lyase
MTDHCVALPGAFNALVGRAVARAGFEGTYISGAAVTASSGVPDVGIRSLDHFCRIIQEVADCSGLPLIADADTGFGEQEMVGRTAIEYHRHGASGMHIEDQVFPKRCGHLDGKSLVPVDHFQEKVAAARRASDQCSDGAFIVCARTDARSTDGLDSAIERAIAYAEAGADMIFPEGLHSEKEFGDFADAMKALPGPARGGGPFLLANMTEFGKTPMIARARFDELGYACVIFPVTTLRIAMQAVTGVLEAIKRDGSPASQLENMQTRAQLYDLLGYTPGEPWDFPSPTAPQ